MPAAAVLYPIPRGGEYIPTGGTYPDARVVYPDGMGSISREGKMGWVHRAEAAGVLGRQARSGVGAGGEGKEIVGKDTPVCHAGSGLEAREATADIDHIDGPTGALEDCRYHGLVLHRVEAAGGVAQLAANGQEGEGTEGDLELERVKLAALVGVPVVPLVAIFAEGAIAGAWHVADDAVEETRRHLRCM